MPKKVENYDNERKEILNKIFNILEINEKNNTFLLHELDTNIDKQNKILELESDIKKYFICGNWTCFVHNDVKRKSLSLIKYLIKDMGLLVMSKRMLIKKEGSEPYRDTVYHILKK